MNVTYDLRNEVNQIIESEVAGAKFRESGMVYMGQFKDPKGSVDIYVSENLGLSIRGLGVVEVHGKDSRSIKMGLSRITKLTSIEFI